MKAANKIISVKYAFVDGAHFFTSDDPIAHGLCAASTDLEIAFKDVSVQLKHLLEHNHGIKVPAIEPELGFQEFLHGLIQSLETELEKRRKLQPKAAAATISPKKMVVGAAIRPFDMLWSMREMAAAAV